MILNFVSNRNVAIFAVFGFSTLATLHGFSANKRCEIIINYTSPLQRKIDKVLVLHKARISKLKYVQIESIDEGLPLDISTKILAHWIRTKAPRESKIIDRVPFYHGSTSQSLLAFFGKNASGLLPNPVIEKIFGTVPLSGELYYGNSPDGVNQIGLSVTPWPKVTKSIEYASLSIAEKTDKDPGYLLNQADLYSREKMRASDWKLWGRNMNELFNRRLRTLDRQRDLKAKLLAETLDPRLRALVESPFPILYGISPRSSKAIVYLDHLFSEPSYLIADQIAIDEIPVVYVLGVNRPQVQALFDLLPPIQRPQIQNLHDLYRSIEQIPAKIIPAVAGLFSFITGLNPAKSSYHWIDIEILMNNLKGRFVELDQAYYEDLLKQAGVTMTEQQRSLFARYRSR